MGETSLTAARIGVTFETGQHLEPIAGFTLASAETRKVAAEVRPKSIGPIHESMAIIGPRFQVLVVDGDPSAPGADTVATAKPVAPAPISSPAVA